MGLVAHGSVLALLAALVLIWAHKTIGSVTYWELRGNRGFRGQMTERYWQRLVLVAGIMLLTGGIVSLLLLAADAAKEPVRRAPWPAQPSAAQPHDGRSGIKSAGGLAGRHCRTPRQVLAAPAGQPIVVAPDPLIHCPRNPERGVV